MTEPFEPTPEHGALRDTVRTFSEREVAPQALAHDREERFNVALFRKLGELGLLGVTVGDAYGGSGLDARAAVIAHEELAAADAGLALAYLAHAILFANNLYRHGSEAQCQRFLPAACAGELIGGMCMSEPGSGTDVLGLRTTAVKKGARYVLNGTKMWTTNGALDETTPGDAFLVYARMEGAARNRLTMFLVENGAPGFRLGQKIHDKLGMRSSTTAELVFENCEVPEDHLVGAEGGATLHMMHNLEIERLTLAAISLGIARRALEIMNTYAKERTSFGEPLNRFGQVQRHIAECYAQWTAGRSYTYATASTLDLDRPGHRLDCDGAKLFCATMAKDVADRAVQVLGGYGYVGEYEVERLWRDAKLLEIGGGTLEAHQKNITHDLSRRDRLR